MLLAVADTHIVIWYPYAVKALCLARDLGGVGEGMVGENLTNRETSRYYLIGNKCTIAGQPMEK